MDDIKIKLHSRIEETIKMQKIKEFSGRMLFRIRPIKGMDSLPFELLHLIEDLLHGVLIALRKLKR